jgi:hypothetical protein
VVATGVASFAVKANGTVYYLQTSGNLGATGPAGDVHTVERAIIDVVNAAHSAGDLYASGADLVGAIASIIATDGTDLGVVLPLIVTDVYNIVGDVQSLIGDVRDILAIPHLGDAIGDVIHNVGSAIDHVISDFGDQVAHAISNAGHDLQRVCDWLEHFFDSIFGWL